MSELLSIAGYLHTDSAKRIIDGRIRLEMLNMLVGGRNWEPMEGSREQRWRDHCFRFGFYHPDYDDR